MTDWCDVHGSFDAYGESDIDDRKSWEWFTKLWLCHLKLDDRCEQAVLQSIGYECVFFFPLRLIMKKVCKDAKMFYFY